MASNSFGKIFRITTFGESHGEALGVVIDGCPAGLELAAEDINSWLQLRKPHVSQYVSPRSEPDKAEILSGVFQGKTTGAPIAIMVENIDTDSSKYEPIKNILRPGHANFTYYEKYGVFDYRGGGRASARETLCRVAAGAVAMKILAKQQIKTAAFVKSIGSVVMAAPLPDIDLLRKLTYDSPVYCPNATTADLMIREIEKVKAAKDSIGGIVEFWAENLPAGLGDPIYSKLEANLASAMLSIPASRGFEIGAGFAAAAMTGKEHNDQFVKLNNKITTVSNNAGGVLGGISTGMPLVGRVAFKPTPSIMQPQKTVDINGDECELQLPAGSRHDLCVAIRAVPVVEAMCALVIADAILYNQAISS
jgi:chorismate synthase